MKIAVDVMGGNEAPSFIIKGIMLAKKIYINDIFFLFGNKIEIKKYITDMKNIVIINCCEKIEDNDEISVIRKKKKSSMILAIKFLKNKKVDAMFSAGNTGVLIAASILYIGCINNIRRPGLITTLPSINKKSIDMIDLGANINNKPEYLLNYGKLGFLYSKYIRNIYYPKVGLLNNGTEVIKGNELIRKTFELLIKNKKKINFFGNIESRDIFSELVDVVITDGFTGNIVLKSIEGIMKNLFKILKLEKNKTFKNKIGFFLLKNFFLKIKKDFDYFKCGSAMLIGINSLVVKVHGASNFETIIYTIKLLHKIFDSKIISKIKLFF